MRIYLCFVALFLVLGSKGQITFQKTYGTVNDEYGYSVSLTSDGGYIIGTPYNGKWSVIKTDAYGDTVWLKTYPFLSTTASYQITHSIIQTKDGNYVMAGSLTDSSAFLLKINSIGDTLWYYKSTHAAYPIKYRKVVEDKDSNLIVVGSREVIISTYCCDPGIIKFHKNGKKIWAIQPYCPGPPGCRFEDISIDNGGNYMITGDAFGSVGPPSPRLLKMDTAGNVVWDKFYYSTMHAQSISLIQSPDSGYVLTGMQADGSDSVCVFKTDKAGNFQWTKRYKGAGTGYWMAYSIDTTFGGYFIAGNTSGNIFLMKLDLGYNYLWSVLYGGTSGETCGQVKSTLDSGCVIIGSSSSFGSGANDVYFIKGDKNGNAAGLKEIMLPGKEIMIYPNPANNRINLQAQKEEIGNVTIFNLIGETVFRTQVKTRRSEIDISGLQNGAYILQCQGRNYKLIKE